MKQRFLMFFLFIFSVQLILSVEPFRFALLTDIHIQEKGNSTEDLENSVKQINESESIDFVLVTGDLTEFGDRKSLEKAKSILEKLNVKYYTIAGNHETKWSASACTDFGRVFGSERFSFEYNGVQFYGFNTGPIIRMADGHIASQDIIWIKKELSKIDKKKPIIIATHYPLQYGDVDNWYEFTDAVRSHNIRVVVGGHYHRNAIFNYDGIPGIINRSNLRGKEKVGGYTLYEITPDSINVFEQTIGGKKRKWTALSMTEKYFEKQGSLTKYPDLSVNLRYPNVKEKWIKKNNASIYSSPVLYENYVYFGDDIGKLHCLNLKNGKEKWSFSSGNRIIGMPAVSENIVVFGSADKFIYGLNAKNGKIKWKIETGEPVLGAVTIDDDIAFIGGSDGCFRAINIKNGNEVWKFCELNNYVETKPLITDDKVIFGAWDTFLYALDKKTGKELWRWTNGIKVTHYSPAAVWSVSSNGKVFIVDPERAMTAIDIENGKTIWRTKASMVRESIGISLDGERIYAKTMQDSVVCYSATHNKATQVWASNVAYEYEHNPSMLIEKDNVVYGSTKNGVIFALDAMTGKVMWQHKIGNSLINTVNPIEKNKVLFTTVGGEVGILINENK